MIGGKWLGYDRGERRTKHRWTQDAAGFVDHGGHRIGKCHASITAEIAGELLNAGIAGEDRAASGLPLQIFNWFRDAVYVAELTEGPDTYHGYPWRQRRPGKGLPKRVERCLLASAEAAGCGKQIREWIKQNRS